MLEMRMRRQTKAGNQHLGLLRIRSAPNSAARSTASRLVSMLTMIRGEKPSGAVENSHPPPAIARSTIPAIDVFGSAAESFRNAKLARTAHSPGVAPFSDASSSMRPRARSWIPGELTAAPSAAAASMSASSRSLTPSSARAETAISHARSRWPAIVNKRDRANAADARNAPGANDSRAALKCSSAADRPDAASASPS